MITLVPTRQRGIVTRQIAVISGLMDSIMMIIPVRETTAEINWIRLCCSVLPILSISLVTRLKISP